MEARRQSGAAESPGPDRVIMPLYDLHAHIVPGVDDGPVTPGEALRLVDRFRGSMPPGSVVVATPHYSSGMSVSALRSRMRKARSFADRVSDPDLDVICAGELKLGLRKSPATGLLCYPGTRWVLAEFPPGLFWFSVIRRSMGLMKKGFKPLFAHVERYRWATPPRVRLLSSLGGGISISLRSLRFPRYRQAAEMLLKSGLCHVITSDCHSQRDMIFGGEAVEFVEAVLPGGWASLAAENPGRILEDDSLPPLREPGNG